MNNTKTMTTLRVFVNEMGEYGNPVGIILDKNMALKPDERQRITTQSGYSECVFINDTQAGNISIHNPQHEVKFAGHALVGTAYYLSHVLNKENSTLKCLGGIVKTKYEDGLTWIESDTTNTPPWNHVQLDNVEFVNNLNPEQINAFEHSVVWSWIDESKGIIRARTFAPDWGIPEDEANGSGAMQLSARTQRNIEVHHGKGSVIYARPLNENIIEVGG